MAHSITLSEQSISEIKPWLDLAIKSLADGDLFKFTNAVLELQASLAANTKDDDHPNGIVSVDDLTDINNLTALRPNGIQNLANRDVLRPFISAANQLKYDYNDDSTTNPARFCAQVSQKVNQGVNLLEGILNQDHIEPCNDERIYTPNVIKAMAALRLTAAKRYAFDALSQLTGNRGSLKQKIALIKEVDSFDELVDVLSQQRWAREKLDSIQGFVLLQREKVNLIPKLDIIFWRMKNIILKGRLEDEQQEKEQLRRRGELNEDYQSPLKQALSIMENFLTEHYVCDNLPRLKSLGEESSEYTNSLLKQLYNDLDGETKSFKSKHMTTEKLRDLRNLAKCLHVSSINQMAILADSDGQHPMTALPWFEVAFLCSEDEKQLVCLLDNIKKAYKNTKLSSASASANFAEVDDIDDDCATLFKQLKENIVQNNVSEKLFKLGLLHLFKHYRQRKLAKSSKVKHVAKQAIGTLRGKNKPSAVAQKESSHLITAEIYFKKAAGSLQGMNDAASEIDEVFAEYETKIFADSKHIKSILSGIKEKLKFIVASADANDGQSPFDAAESAQARVMRVRHQQQRPRLSAMGHEDTKHTWTPAFYGERDGATSDSNSDDQFDSPPPPPPSTLTSKRNNG